MGQEISVLFYFGDGYRHAEDPGSNTCTYAQVEDPDPVPLLVNKCVTLCVDDGLVPREYGVGPQQSR